MEYSLICHKENFKELLESIFFCNVCQNTDYD